ncbi:MAG: hypothetical protein SGJ27_07910 [Candidatus Melainabacteria bacterium]|nr:hypothetical protein [Candidatus Melainabacteria bacterium]
MQSSKAQYQGVQPMQSMVGLKVTEVPKEDLASGFRIQFEDAHISGTCSHYFRPETFEISNLAEGSIVLVEEIDGRFELVFDCGATLVIDPAPDERSAPEAFKYRNENYEPPLVVICHKRDQ